MNLSRQIRSVGAMLHFIMLSLVGNAEEIPVFNPDVIEYSDTLEPRVDASGIGGPSSVQGQLESDRRTRQSEHILPISDVLEAKWGLTTGLDYNSLWLGALSPVDRNAVGGVARFYGEWAPIQMDDERSGKLIFKIENRHTLGTRLAPQGLGPSYGYNGLNGVTFSKAGPILSNLYWNQQFHDNRFAFGAGVVDPGDYLDVYGLVNVWEEFNNLAFTTNPTIAAPKQGLGAAFRAVLSDHHYVLLGIADANGDPSTPSMFFDSFFETGEYFRHIEVGWFESWENRFSNNIHLTLWQADARTASGTPDGWGAAFSANHLIDEKWLPFFRAGYSDGGGTIVDRSVSVGTGYRLNEANDYIGVGVNWGRAPAAPGIPAEDQYATELYFRKNLLNNLQLVPSVQFIANPAQAPTIDSLWLLGCRVRATF